LVFSGRINEPSDRSSAASADQETLSESFPNCQNGRISAQKKKKKKRKSREICYLSIINWDILGDSFSNSFKISESVPGIGRQPLDKPQRTLPIYPDPTEPEAIDVIN
jgi:hypothetical protein